MRRLIVWAASFFIGVAILVSATPMAAYAAADIFNSACSGQTDSATCNSVSSTGTSNPLTGTNGVLLNVAKIIAVIAGLSAIIVIIISGFSYVTADGDAQKAKKARDALVGALVGLFIIGISSVVITFVINNSGVK